MKVVNEVLKSAASQTPLGAFKFDKHQVRTVLKDGEVWFAATDACKVLGIKDTSDACSRLDEDEKDTAQTRTPGGDQTVIVINLPGLVRLISRSDKPEAKNFQRWIFHDVIPSIYKTGRYEVNKPDKPPELENNKIEIPISISGPGQYFVVVDANNKAVVSSSNCDAFSYCYQYMELIAICYAIKTIEAYWEQQVILAKEAGKPNLFNDAAKLADAIMGAVKLASPYLH